MGWPYDAPYQNIPGGANTTATAAFANSMQAAIEGAMAGTATFDKLQVAGAAGRGVATLSDGQISATGNITTTGGAFIASAAGVAVDMLLGYMLTGNVLAGHRRRVAGFLAGGSTVELYAHGDLQFTIAVNCSWDDAGALWTLGNTGTAVVYTFTATGIGVNSMDSHAAGNTWADNAWDHSSVLLTNAQTGAMTVTGALAAASVAATGDVAGATVTPKHLLSAAAGAPAFASTASAGGAGRTNDIDARSTDMAMNFHIHSGAAPSNNTKWGTVTFNAAYAAAPRAIVLTPGKSPVGAGQQSWNGAVFYTTNWSTAGFDVWCDSGASAANDYYFAAIVAG